jgi:hypothetical protein
MAVTTITGKSVTLQGRADGETCYALTQCFPGPTCPAPSSTAPLVTLDGGNDGRVLTISGASNVNLRNLTITPAPPTITAGWRDLLFRCRQPEYRALTISFNYAGSGAEFLELRRHGKPATARQRTRAQQYRAVHRRWNHRIEDVRSVRAEDAS